MSSNLIARAKKALEFDHDKHPYGIIHGPLFQRGLEHEHDRTAKLVEALLEIAETVSVVNIEEADRCTKILEAALDEMEIK